MPFRSVLNTKSKEAGRLGRWRTPAESIGGSQRGRALELSSSRTTRGVKLAARSGLWKSPSDPGNVLWLMGAGGGRKEEEEKEIKIEREIERKRKNRKEKMNTNERAWEKKENVK